MLSLSSTHSPRSSMAYKPKWMNIPKRASWNQRVRSEGGANCAVAARGAAVATKDVSLDEASRAEVNGGELAAGNQVAS
jgi:hypothetical protein